MKVDQKPPKVGASAVRHGACCPSKGSLSDLLEEIITFSL